MGFQYQLTYNLYIPRTNRSIVVRHPNSPLYINTPASKWRGVLLVSLCTCQARCPTHIVGSTLQSSCRVCRWGLFTRYSWDVGLGIEVYLELWLDLWTCSMICTTKPLFSFCLFFLTPHRTYVFYIIIIRCIQPRQNIFDIHWLRYLEGLNVSYLQNTIFVKGKISIRQVLKLRTKAELCSSTCRTIFLLTAL